MSRRALLIAALVSLAIACLIGAARGGFDAATPAEGYQAWSDGFFTAAVLVGGAGALAFASSDGHFDAIRFSIGKALNAVRKKEKRKAYPKTFYDYRMMKRGRPTGGLAALVAGAICLLVAGLFLSLYFTQGV